MSLSSQSPSPVSPVHGGPTDIQDGMADGPRTWLSEPLDLLQAEFSRAGDDLLIQDPSGPLRLEGYFYTAAAPTLMLPNGSGLTPETVQSLLGPYPGSYQVAGPTDASGPASAPQIGVARFVLGRVTIKGADGETHTLHRGDPVFQGDELRTGSNGLVKIRLSEGTQFQLGRDARAVLDDLQYAPEEDKGSFKATVLLGAFRYVSGAIAEVNPGQQHSKIVTPTATVGIRGSALDGLVEQLGTTTIIHYSGFLVVIPLVGVPFTVNLDLPGESVLVNPDGSYRFTEQIDPQAAERIRQLLPPQAGAGEGQEQGEQGGSPSDGSGAPPRSEGSILNQGLDAPNSQDDSNPPPQGGEQGPSNDTGNQGGTGQTAGPSGDIPPDSGQEPDLPVPNQPPIAGDDQVAGIQSATLIIDVLTNDVDPETGATPTIVAFDMTSAAGGTVSLLKIGEKLVYTPPTGFSGTDRFGYTVADAEGATSRATVTIDVIANTPPVATDDQASTTQDIPITIAVLTNDSDPDGDSISLLDADSTSLNGGGVLLTADGQITYTPATGFSGSDQFNYTILDSKGTSDTAQVNIEVIANDPPVANDDQASTLVDTTVDIPVLSNDSDPDGNSIRISAFDATSINGGAIVDNGSGVLGYRPPAGFAGSDSFNYTLTDGLQAFDTATVTVTVQVLANQPPDAVNDSASTTSGASIGIPVLNNDNDPDGDPLSVIQFDPLTALGGAVVPFSSSNPDLLIYRPPGNFQGQDSFSYTIGDGNGGQDTASVVITVAPPPNQPPVANDDQVLFSYGGGAVSVNVLANDTDPNGDPLVIANFDSTTSQGGVVSQTGPGQLSYNNGPGLDGPDTFVYTVSDGRGGLDTATVAVFESYGGSQLQLDRGTETTGITTVPADDPGNEPLLVKLSSLELVEDGSGNNSLVLRGDGQILDLSLVSSLTPESIDTLDLNDPGAQTVSLHIQDVLDLSASDALTISGNKNDQIQLLGGDWQAQGALSLSGTDYQVYQGSLSEQTATLLLDQELQISVV